MNIECIELRIRPPLAMCFGHYLSHMKAHMSAVLSPPPLPLNLKSILALASSWILGLFDSMTVLFFTL